MIVPRVSTCASVWNGFMLSFNIVQIDSIIDSIAAYVQLIAQHAVAFIHPGMATARLSISACFFPDANI